MCGTKLESEAAELPLQPHQLSTENDALVQVTHGYPLEGERRVATVVLTDLTDSTHLLEKIGTEGWVELMHRILHILESEINRFGGEVSQFRGDGLVAFFGATSAHEDDPERAVLAALTMQRALEHYLREEVRPEAADLQMRVGVNTGEVIVASGTDRQHWVETAMGEAVAIAARMEDAAEPGTVLVSENTYRLIQTQFEWQSLGEILIKGISQPMTVFRPKVHITEPLPLSSGLIFEDSTLLVGRDSEFHTLKASVDGLFNGRGCIVTLTGDKGSGKSLLLNEVRQYFAHRGALLAESQAGFQTTATALTWAGGRCRSYSQTWPYSMWLNLFHDWTGMRPDQSKEEKRACLRRHTEELWGNHFDEHYPYLTTFLGLPLEDTFTEKIRHLDGEGLRQSIFRTVRSWIEISSRKNPLVLTFSDIQWADDSSIALLKYCLPVADNETLLWLLTFRLERDLPVWKFYHFLEAEYPHRLVAIDLSPFTDSQSLELINHLIGAQTLPKEIQKLIIHNASGNAYYILELIRALIAKGILTRDSADSPWRLARNVTTLDLPDSLQRLLLARIDRLSAQQRSVLQLAAVIGPVFWLNMLQELLGEIPIVRDDLISLQRNEFIQESGRVPELGMQYQFKTPLIRDAAYDSLLSTQRAAYHLKAAEYLENFVDPDVLGGYDGMLAYHYGGAGNPRKEMFYTVLAAEQARKIYANAEALQYYNRAIELLDKLEAELAPGGKIRSIQTQRFEVLRGRRAVLLDLSEIEPARADTHALLSLAHQMEDDRIWLIEALLAHSDFPANNREELRPSLQMAEEALVLARELGDKRRELFSLISVASIRLTLREPGSLGLAEEALALARQLGDLPTEVSILLGIGNAYGMDDLPRSREYLEAALVRSESLNDKKIEIVLLEALGRQFERDGDYYRQLTEYEQKRLKLSREIGNRYVEGMTLMFCGQIQGLYLGDYESGLNLEREVLRIWEPITGRLFPLLRIAQILTAQGQYAEASTILESAHPLGDKVVMDIGRAGLGMVTIILFNALGDESHLWSALDRVAQIQQMSSYNLVSQQYRMAAACEASNTHLKLASYYRESNKDEYWKHLRQALESSQLALDLYQHFGFVQIVECTSEEILYRHSQALAVNGHATEAAEFLKRAYEEMLRKHGLIPIESPFRKSFLENIELHREIRAAYTARSILSHSTSIPDSK